MVQRQKNIDFWFLGPQFQSHKDSNHSSIRRSKDIKHDFPGEEEGERWAYKDDHNGLKFISGKGEGRILQQITEA